MQVSNICKKWRMVWLGSLFVYTPMEWWMNFGAACWCGSCRAWLACDCVWTGVLDPCFVRLDLNECWSSNLHRLQPSLHPDSDLRIALHPTNMCVLANIPIAHTQINALRSTHTLLLTCMFALHLPPSDLMRTAQPALGNLRSVVQLAFPSPGTPHCRLRTLLTGHAFVLQTSALENHTVFKCEDQRMCISIIRMFLTSCIQCI